MTIGKIENYLKKCKQAEKEGKVVISISLPPKQAEWVKDKRNTSAYFQQLIEQEMEKQPKTTEDKLVKEFSDLMVEYGFYEPPDLEVMKQYKAYVTNEGDFSRFKEENLAPEYYIFSVIMHEGVKSERCNRDFTPKEKQLLKEARKVPHEQRLKILWQAVQDALKRTEIREGLPRIQFVANELIDYTKRYLALDREKVKNITITALAEKAGIPFQQFYTRELPKIKKILDWNGVDVGIK